MIRRVRALLCLLLLWCLASVTRAQVTGGIATIRWQGLRTVNYRGSFHGASYTPDGNLILLFDDDDGIRLLKTDATAQTILAEAHSGAAGDVGLALVPDGTGGVYVAGTSTSGMLPGTAGAAFSAAQNSSTNSFVARFDADLNPVFLTFLGAGQTSVTGLAATSNSVYVTGLTYSTAFPTTPGAVEPLPATGSLDNGFVARLSADGSTLQYATYLTGSGGGTRPANVAVDTAGNAYVAGSTSAPGFPTSAALQPTLTGASAGFLIKLNAAGSAIAFSTLVPGSGLSSVAWDGATGSLLVTGDISSGQFPITTVTDPIAKVACQSLLRISDDGRTLLDSVLLMPGNQSVVAVGANGTAWVAGSLTLPLPWSEESGTEGDSYLLHLTASDEVDQQLRLGGTVANHPAQARLESTINRPVLSSDGQSLVIAGGVVVQTEASLLADQSFRLGVAGVPGAVLPDTVRDLLPETCSAGLPCAGSGGWLTGIAVTGNGASLSLSDGDLPNVVLRNTGPVSATDVTITTSGFTSTSNCPQVLPGFGQCTLVLSGVGPGSISVASSNAPAVQLAVAALTSTAQPLAFDASELDFGVVTADSSPALRTVTLTNLSGTAQTFASAPDNVPTAAPYTVAETASTCSGPPSAHVVTANGSCSVTLGLTASSLAANDGPVAANWSLGARDITLTGFTQAASLSVSASEIDFGAQPAGTARLPRYLYLSNSSNYPVPHAAVDLAGDSPFAVSDGCPSMLEPDSVCQIILNYEQTNVPAVDSATLVLDQGITVLVTGQPIKAPATAASAAAPPLLVAPSLVSFTGGVPVSAVSDEVQVVRVTNTSDATVSLIASVLGDFSLQNTCNGSLAPGDSCDVGLHFTPSQTGIREGLLTISAGSEYQPSEVALSGTGTSLLGALGESLAMGETPVGEPLMKWVQLQGSFPAVSVNISGRGFGVALLADDGAGHGTLAASQFGATASAACTACWLGISFLPQVPGSVTGDLQLSTQATGMPLHLSVSAVAVPRQGLLLTPSQQSFGAIPVNSTTAPVTFTLTHLLPDPTSITIQEIRVDGDFVVQTGTDPLRCASTLAPTSSCRVQVAFAPTAKGARSGTLTVATSAGTVSASLAGTGTADPGVAVRPASIAFQDGITTTSVQLTNTGASTISVGSLVSSLVTFQGEGSCATLAPGQSCVVQVTLLSSTAGSGTIPIPVSSVDQGGTLNQTTLTVPLSYQPQAVSVFPAQADFGPQPAGTAGQIRQFTLTNDAAGPRAITLAGARHFPLAGISGCDTLSAGTSCTFSVLFLPETAGPVTGAVTITASASDGSATSLGILPIQGYGIGTGSLVISAGTDPKLPLRFGQVASGATANQTVTLSNIGGSPVDVRRLTSTVPYSAATDCVGLLAPGASCSVELTYAPLYEVAATASQKPRTDPGTLLIESDAVSSPDTVYLAGSVTPAVTTSLGQGSALPTYTLSASAVTFPNTETGVRSAEQVLTLANTGSLPVNFLQVLAPADFPVSSTCTTLASGDACTVSVAFAPGTLPVADNVHAATLTILSDAVNPLEFVSLLGSSFASPLQLTPLNVNFGPTAQGSSAQATVTATNVSSLPLVLGTPLSQGDFATAAGTCPTDRGSLAPEQSCAFALSFSPTVAGLRTGDAAFSSPSADKPVIIALQGTGLAGQLQVTPSQLDFGRVALTQSASLTLALSNTGSAPLTGLAGAITGANASDFAVTTFCNSPSLAVAATCTMQIVFTPSAPGPRSANFTVASSDPASPITIPLTGTGLQAPGILLTVHGGTAWSATIFSGGTATYPLLLTPQGGFAGPVELTCSPVSPAPNASCSLLADQISAVTAPTSDSASITTLGGMSASMSGPFGASAAAVLVFVWGRRRIPGSPALSLAVSGFGLASAIFFTGCVGGPGSAGEPYTPPGTYTYQVTARSTDGTVLRSSVNLSLVVQ